MVSAGGKWGRGRASVPVEPPPLTSSSQIPGSANKGTFRPPALAPESRSSLRGNCPSPAPRPLLRSPRKQTLESQASKHLDIPEGPEEESGPAGFGDLKRRIPMLPGLPHSRLRWMDGVGVEDCVTTFRERV